MFEEMSRHEIVFFLGLMYLFWSQVHIQRNIRKLEDENYELKRKISDLELEEKKSGYFASNRPDGKGFDDIYSFSLIQNSNLNETIFDLSNVKIQSGYDLAKLFELEDIYFEKNEWDITQNEVFKLQILLEILKQNPEIKINIRAHTDSRASKNYNLNLSQKRADATMHWLIENGINKNRLSANGFGEKYLMNECADGIPCTEQEHKINRRSEFIVLLN